MVRTLVVGIDAATWQHIDPLLERDELPNLQKIVRQGQRGTLDSTRPPMTPLAWTSMATGVNPGKHGIYDFRKQDPSTYRVTPVQYDDIDRPTIWDVFDKEDQSIGVVNFPVAVPAPDVGDFFVSGFPAGPDDDIVSPPEAREHLPDGYYIQPKRDPSDDPAAYLRELKNLTEMRCDLTLSLADEYDPDLLWSVFMAIDWVQHYLWNEDVDGVSAVKEMYRFVDEQIGRLLDGIDEDVNVVVVSDHGFTELEGEIHLNGLLESLGELERVSRDLDGRIKSTVVEIGVDVLDLLPNRLRSRTIDVSKRVLPQEMLKTGEQVAGTTGQRYLHERVDWTQTTAFSYGSMGRIFLNRSNRYPNGTVHPEDLESYRNELAEKLLAVEHPNDGSSLFEAVTPGTELYEGENISSAPDLVVTPTKWQFMSYGDFGTQWVHQPEKRQADHHPEGIAILGLSQAEQEESRLQLEVEDIAPTLLAVHDLPLVEDMDGTVLESVNNKSHRNLPLSAFDGGASERRDDDQGVEDRLEDLGYL